MTAPAKNLRLEQGDASGTFDAVVEGRGLSALAAGRKFALSAFNVTPQHVEKLMPDYAKILKFNPYHDQRGRFTTRGGIGHAGVHFVSVGDKFKNSNERDKREFAEWQKKQAAEKPEFIDLVDPDGGHIKDFDKAQEMRHAINKQDEAWVKATRDNFDNKLSDSDRASIYTYTEDSSHYNKALATDKTGRWGNENAIVRGIDSAMEASSGAPDNMKVWRGLNVSSLGISDNFWRDMTSDDQVAHLSKLVGQTYKEKGFGSTAITRTRAEAFLKPTRVMAVIEVKKGQKSVYLGSGQTTTNGYTMNRSNYPHEKELLLPRNAGYKIKSVERHPTQGYAVMTVEYLGDMGN